MKKLMIFSMICSLLLVVSCDNKPIDVALAKFKQLEEMIKRANDIGVKVPDEVNSLITKVNENKGNINFIVTLLNQEKLEQALLLMQLTLQKNENKIIEDSVKVAQENLEKYREKYESRKNPHTKTKEAP